MLRALFWLWLLVTVIHFIDHYKWPILIFSALFTIWLITEAWNTKH
jgi:hypothetical protein